MLEGEIFEIMTVRQFPPIESFNNLVNFEFLYGIYFDPSANALIQLPNANKLLLIFAPSRNLA